MNAWSTRQRFLGDDSDAVLAGTTATVIGTSGGGCHIAHQLVHIGFGRVNLIDPDIAEDHHAHRLLGITRSAVIEQQPKADMLFARLSNVPSQSKIVPYVAKWQAHHPILRDSHIVFSCLDTYLAREELERYCRRFLVPMIDIGMDVVATASGHQIAGQVIASIPNQACMRCLGFLRDELLVEEANRYGAMGGRPQSIWPNGTLASTAIGLAMQMILPWSQSPWCPYYEYDGNTLIVRPHPRLGAINHTQCRHRWDLGDPFWIPKDAEHSALVCNSTSD